MKRRNLALLGAAAIAASAFATVGYGRSKRDAGPKMRTVKVDRGRIVARATATGALSAMVTVQVGSQVSGRLSAIEVDFGSLVKKGQVIAHIDPALFQATEQQARANRMAAAGNLAKAEAQAAEAERQLGRAQALAERHLVAAADLDSARGAAEAARAGVAAARGGLEQARAALSQARVSLAYTTIVSPINGVVISRSVDVGQTVAASLQSPTLFTIAEDLRKMQVHASVAEADVGRLRPGMPASFTVDAYPGERFKGAVRQVRDAPQMQQNVVTYDAVIDVDNPELRLKPGMTANVTFVCAERDDVLRVPTAALRFHLPADMVPGAAGAKLAAKAEAKAEGKGKGKGRGKDKAAGEPRSVWLLRDGVPSEVQVQTGVSDGNTVEVLSGDLKDGDAVITELVLGTGKGGSGASSKKAKGIF